MDRVVLLPLILLMLPAACLCVAWAVRPPESTDGSGRTKITQLGLIVASVAMFANGAFLLHGAAVGRGGFPEPPEEPWLAINLVAVALWACAILSVIFGKGWKTRIALVVWGVLAVVVDYGIVIVTKD
jgi:hypothetical protein